MNFTVMSDSIYMAIFGLDKVRGSKDAFQSLNSDECEHGWRFYSLPNGTMVPFYQSTRTILQNGTTGLCSWPAAFKLAEFGYLNPELFKSSSVLELGSGIGAGGIFLSALTNTKCITLTDVNSEVLEILKKNAQAVEDRKIVVEELDWCSFDKEHVNQMLTDLDLIVGADLLYDPSIFPALVQER